jgi:predicted alpha-1,6-mannanase (GH76 family)
VSTGPGDAGGVGSDTDTQLEIDMAKNPFMSAYLSAANRAANTARGKATVEVKRAAKREQTNMVNAWTDMMTGGATRRRRKRR